MGMFKKEDENYVYELVSRNITRIREMKGMTKKELAEKTYFNSHFIYNIENPKYHQTFSLTTLVLLAKGLDVDIREFFVDDTPEQENEKK